MRTVTGLGGERLEFDGFTTMGKSWSRGVVVECRCRNAVVDASGSSCRMDTISLPGVEPAEVVSRQSTVELERTPAVKYLVASFCMATQVSADA